MNPAKEDAPKRGEVWWVDLEPVVGSEIAKIRPCVVMGRDRMNEQRRTVVVVPLSTGPAPGPPIHVPVLCDGAYAVAVVDQIRSVAKARFRKKTGKLTDVEVTEIGQALVQILDLH